MKKIRVNFASRKLDCQELIVALMSIVGEAESAGEE